ncbi:hypothetical protein [Streptomyces qaidamensis]|uniref:hypothetical protein n=1 Tax=Streptomyces qaidamensis TaxID=1783515 RepID=UPI000AE92DD9
MNDVPVPYQVTGVRRETADTVSLTLTPAGEEAPEPFAPGQFAMVYAFGVGDIPVSVSRLGGRELVHTIRSVRAVSAALGALRPGSQVTLRGPFGTGWGLERAAGQDIVVVTGGIGIAPLRPLVLAALAARRFCGQLNLLVGSRTAEDLVHADRMRTWAESHGPPHRRVTVDRPSPSWWGHVGLVTTLLNSARFVPGNTTAYVRGPEAMIVDVVYAVDEALNIIDASCAGRHQARTASSTAPRRFASSRANRMALALAASSPTPSTTRPCVPDVSPSSWPPRTTITGQSARPGTVRLARSHRRVSSSSVGSPSAAVRSTIRTRSSSMAPWFCAVGGSRHASVTVPSASSR